MTTRTFTTIISTNYLPKALALGESLRRHEDGARLKIVFIDYADDEGLPELDGVDCLSLAVLGLSRHTIAEMTMTYDLVEFATAIKPLLFRRLLEDAEQVFYLDPDTYVVSPMVELSPELEKSAGGILLTPHFLRPPPKDAELSDGHMLHCGVNNLGFCGFDRRAFDLLDWWWGHLRTECLYDPLAGLFVDQKWMDIGATLFEAGSLRQAGYNVGLGNLVERPIAQDDDGYYIGSTGDRLRLFHFHAFDPRSPKNLSQRFRHTTANELDDDVLLQLCKEYAEVLLGYEESLPPAPPYPWNTDTRGRTISLLQRRAYLRDTLRSERPLPSPFDAADADAYEQWRRRSWQPIARGLLDETAKFARIVLPEQYLKIRKRFPGLADKLNNRFSGGAGSWG